MTQARVMLVGTFEDDSNHWQNGLALAGFAVSPCKYGFEALAELNRTGIDVMVSKACLADLDALQLCGLLRATETTSYLPFVIIGQVPDQQQSLPKLLATLIPTLELEDIERDKERVIALIQEQIAQGKKLGWKSEPVGALARADDASASLDAKQAYSKLLNDLIIEKLVGRFTRALTFNVEPHKRFLQAYFETTSKLINADLSGIAIGHMQNSWLALQGKPDLSESSLNELIGEVKSELSLTDDPLLEIEIATAVDGGTHISERHILSVPTEGAGRGLILFANWGNNPFSRADLVAMDSLRNQMQPVVQLLLAQQEIESFHTREAYNASVDQLTGLYNLQFLLGFLQQQLLLSFRHRLPVGLLIMDIDNFAWINSSLGVQVGDAILMKLASHLLNSIRASDLCARYGGDEFAVVLPNTDLHGAQVLAEKLRLDIEQIPFFEGAERPAARLTMSIGCAQFDLSDLNPETILRDAKHALQKAKETGKNRVSV